jgi:predicted alpha/beta-fold hydrolase
VHGYHNAQDYYARASAKYRLPTIKLPTLLLNPKNDPFVPLDILHGLKVSAAIQVEQPEHGGHVGFAVKVKGGTAGVGELSWLPQRLYDWFTTQAGV